MRTRLNPLFVTTLLVLSVQQANAELSPPPVWNTSQIPITWGDCIPVPIAPMPNNMHPAQMMPPAFMAAPYPVPMQGSMPMMAPNGAPLLPPPSPFFNTSERPLQVAPAIQPACDNKTEIKLKKLQSRYKQAAAASRNKIEELTQALEDTRNQMTDAREAIESLSKEQESVKTMTLSSAQEDANNQLSDAREIIEKLSNEQESNKTEIGRFKTLKDRNENNRLSLHKELQTAKKNMAEQLEKMRSTNTLTMEKNLKANAKVLQLQALQNNQESNRLSLHEELNVAKHNMAEELERLQLSNSLAIEKNAKANAKILQLQALQNNQESNRLSLHNELAEAKKNATEQTNNIISKLSAEMNTLKETNEEQNNENLMLNELEVALNKKLSDLDNTNKSLKAKLSLASNDAMQQGRKLTALSRSTQELGALKSAYKERNENNAELKEKLSALEKNKGSLNSKLDSLQTASTLKGAQDQDIINSLKKQLASLDDANKTLKTKLASIETNAGAQARKLTALGQSASKLTALQSAYKERNNESIALKKKLTEFDNANKSLKTQLASAETNAGSQARKLTALGQSATELTALQSAYKERNNESIALKKKLAEFDNANKSLKTQLTSAETNAGSQARKLTALGQSASKLTAMQSAYETRNEENASLKNKLDKLSSLQTACTLKGAQDQSIIDNLNKKLASLDDANKTFKTQLSSAEKDAGAQARKLTALSQSSSKLSALQSSYKERNEEAMVLKGQLAQLKNSLDVANKTCTAKANALSDELSTSVDKNKSLLAKITTLESASSGQARKITALMTTSEELIALKSAYKDLNNKKADLSSELIAAKADTDKDGVLDSSDKCPSTLEGVEVNALGCFADIDNDGVADNKDKCPSSPVGTQVNEKGCPKIIDADGDAVADASDLCPNTSAGSTVNEFGCTPTESITLEGVNFATGSARLTASSLPLVAAAAETLKKSPNLNIEIAGYTDNQGLGTINKRLSQRRANTVMIQLIKDGVDANRLTAKGYGEKDPVASNDTQAGRATNRRVELKIRQ